MHKRPPRVSLCVVALFGIIASPSVGATLTCNKIGLQSKYVEEQVNEQPYRRCDPCQDDQEEDPQEILYSTIGYIWAESTEGTKYE